MISILNPNKKVGYKTASVAATLIIFMSACANFSSESEDNGEMAMKEKMAEERIQEAKDEENTVRKEEDKKFARDREEEIDEDKDFGQMKRELSADEAAGASMPGASVSKMFFDNEMLAINERIHHLSQRVEEVSERVHSLAGLVEQVPSKVAELELAAIETKELLRSLGAAPVSSTREGTTSAEPFWGVQVGAYRTRTGAKNGWSEILANQAAIQLNDAKVQYFLSKPLKSGNRLTLIVINNYPSYGAANSACKELKEVSVDCVAVRINP